jgi:hypothetical protein
VAQGKESIRVYLTPEIKDRLKTTCFLKGLNMSDIAAELIEDWLTNNDVEISIQKKSSTSKNQKGEDAV